MTCGKPWNVLICTAFMLTGKLNIIILGPAYPLRGGLATYNERLARAFQEEGHQARILTFSLQYPGFLFPGTTQYSQEAPPEGLTIEVAVNSINPFNWWRVGNKIKKEKPDLIIVRYWLPFMGPCLGTILRRIRSNGHTRIICIADNIIPHEQRFFDTAFTRFFVKPVHAFITMSEKVLQDLKQFSSRPARYVPHPVYDTFGPAIEREQACNILALDTGYRYLLFFGFIRQYKGLDWLLTALHQLKQTQYLQNQKIKCIIAGEFYESAEPYLDQIKQLGLQEDLVLHTHFINDSEVRNYFSACDLVVQPYKQATQSGITPLSYYYDKPTLVTRVGGLFKFVEHGKTGLICEASPESIAEGIQLFFSKNTHDFLEPIREAKKTYRWSHIVESSIELAGASGFDV